MTEVEACGSYGCYLSPKSHDYTEASWILKETVFTCLFPLL